MSVILIFFIYYNGWRLNILCFVIGVAQSTWVLADSVEQPAGQHQ